MGGTATSFAKQRRLKGLKGRLLTHINKHSHSWPLLLPHCLSLTHKYPNTSEVHPPSTPTPSSPPPPSQLPNSSSSPTHSRKAHIGLKKKEEHSYTVHLIHTASYSICEHNACMYAGSHRLSISTHTNTPREGEEVNITLLSRMQKKFMLPLERERGILCELR